ncbi:hypothetical protein R3P38DRAFT_3295456 [Favolaschia claudopus]|uniref:DUF6589 domain-containing protein n=1 Tax=Favolaschia claudopus TaxID=2862362 RepID=A0AAV9ZBD2_9AGAR
MTAGDGNGLERKEEGEDNGDCGIDTPGKQKSGVWRKLVLGKFTVHQSGLALRRRFFLHNWLVNLTGRPYSFKEIDLLQEHQNFWAKIIYNAKGANRSWDWLSMITVCIFTLRETMRSVQKSFDIPAYGENHTIPNITAEVQKLADALADEKIQEYVINRPVAITVTAVRDLLEEGAKYADTRGAFKKFTRETRKAELVPDGEEGGIPDSDSDEEEGSMQEDYEVTNEDLGVDEEEPYADPSALLEIASELIGTAT